MPIQSWQDELIAAAAQWPRQFRARLSSGIWELLGASQSVKQEFQQWAERIGRELKFPRGDTDATTALLYRLKANGYHVRSTQVRKTHGNSQSLQGRFTIDPLRGALIQYVHGGFGKDSKPIPNARIESGSSWQIAAAKRNRVRAERLAVIAALQDLGCPLEAPSFVREFHNNLREHPDFRQPISPPPFQLPNFDRLNQSRDEWKVISQKAFEQHCDQFLRRRQFWVDAGVDDEIPPAKSTRGVRTQAVRRKRRNTAIKLRYRWAAQYLCRIPLKEIAAQSDADSGTVGRIARAILKEAAWLKPRRRGPSAD